MKWIFFLASLVISISLKAQFPGPAGTPGSTAISADSAIFLNWANAIDIERGFQNISEPTLGRASGGVGEDALGPADRLSVVSLGDGGIATVTFPRPIRNGEGPDFAVFENAFSDRFLELAFVEVSSNGVDFFRFPATSNIPTDRQIGPFDERGDATLLNNLAGKYRSGFGTPFDLEELVDIPELNVNLITHVKIIDVVGSINPDFASFDQNNQAINDPFPTSFETGGFDLDAIGVIHEAQVSSTATLAHQETPLVAPNPFPIGSSMQLQFDAPIQQVELCSADGRFHYQGRENIIPTQSLSAGVYFLRLKTLTGRYYWQKLLLK